MKTEAIKVQDDKGFHYGVLLEYIPIFGLAKARFKGEVIASVELGGKMYEPVSDNDEEWERYEEKFSEWTDEVKANILPKCVEYFNKIK